jgi:hypothetical protein
MAANVNRNRGFPITSFGKLWERRNQTGEHEVITLPVWGFWTSHNSRVLGVLGNGKWVIRQEKESTHDRVDCGVVCGPDCHDWRSGQRHREHRLTVSELTQRR